MLISDERVKRAPARVASRDLTSVVEIILPEKIRRWRRQFELRRFYPKRVDAIAFHQPIITRPADEQIREPTISLANSWLYVPCVLLRLAKSDG